MPVYKSSGTGATIVFIHGLSQSAEIWYLLKNSQYLQGYRLVFIDLPGHGTSYRSTNPERDYTIKGLAGYLELALNAIGCKEYIIVAASLATCLVGEIIQLLSGCKGLFLIGACPIGRPFTVDQIVRPNPNFGVTFTSQPDNNALDKYIADMAKDIDPDVANHYKTIFRETDPRCREEAGKSVANADWSDEIANLENFPVPIALVYGEAEAVINTAYLKRSAIRKWRDTIILIANSGHCCYLDKPGETASLIAQYTADILY